MNCDDWSFIACSGVQASQAPFINVVIVCCLNMQMRMYAFATVSSRAVSASD